MSFGIPVRNGLGLGLLASTSLATGNVGGSAPFTPASLFASGAPGFLLDATLADLSSLFQDSAGTTPVTAVEQPVGRVLDTSGRGNHFVQSTSAARPVLSARVNLLTKTEQFDDAAWTKAAVTVTANATTAPNGTTTADLMVPSTSVAFHTVSAINLTVPNTNMRVTLRFKAAGYNFVALQFTNNSTFTKYYEGVFNLSTGAVEGTGRNVTYTGSRSITSLGDGWYQCTLDINNVDANSTSSVQFVPLPTNDPTGSYAGNGTSGVYAWGADLRVANDTASPVYQRVNTSTDYDTTGFPLYLRYDGVDDFMSSPLALSTLGLTVWFGFRKTGNVGVSSRYFFMGDTTGSVNSLGALQNAIGYRWPENTNVPLGSDDISTRLVSYQRASTTSQTANLNGIAVSPNTSLTTTFTSATSRLGCNIVSGLNDLFFNGRIYFPLVVLGRTATATEITNMESYLSASMGGGYVPTGYDFLVTGDGDQLTDASGNALYTIPLYS